METCAPYDRYDIAYDIDATWGAIDTATLDNQLQAKNWYNWVGLSSCTQQYPYLQDGSITIHNHLLLRFSAWNRQGYYSRGRHVAQIIFLLGYYDLRRSYGSTDINLPFSWLLKSYETNDLAPKPKLALPIWDIQYVTYLHCIKQTLGNTLVVELITIALFSLIYTAE